MYDLQIVMGSKSDLELVKSSGMFQILEDVLGKERYGVNICSAHRNAPDLLEFARSTSEQGTKVYIGIAGMAAALPGALAGASTVNSVVIAVPLDENGIDSCLYMPPGVPVALAGVGKTGLKQAALLACQVIGMDNPQIRGELALYRATTTSRPVFDFDPLELNQGKTKIIRWASDREVFIISKDDITAEDGAKRDILEGKAVCSTQTTSNVFKLLEAHRIDTHYLGMVNATTFRARAVDMIPLELVIRRIATGSYIKRNPEVADGTFLESLVFELFEKDDANHDPMLEFDFKAGVLRRYVAKVPKSSGLISEEPLAASRYNNITPQILAKLNRISMNAFLTLEIAWAVQSGVLYDFKIECGFDRQTDKLLVADVIDNDSWRLRFNNVSVDKQGYRDGSQTLGEIKLNYDAVAEMTEKFINI